MVLVDDGKWILVYCVLLLVWIFGLGVWGGDKGVLFILIFMYCRFGLEVSLIEFFLVLSFFVGKIGLNKVFFGEGMGFCFLFLLLWWWDLFLLKLFNWGEFFWKFGEGGIMKEKEE